MRTISDVVASGYRRRILRICASTTGRWIASTRSMLRIMGGCSAEPTGGSPPTHGESSDREWILCTLAITPILGGRAGGALGLDSEWQRHPAQSDCPVTARAACGSDEEVGPLEVFGE